MSSLYSYLAGINPVASTNDRREIANGSQMNCRLAP